MPYETQHCDTPTGHFGFHYTTRQKWSAILEQGLDPQRQLTLQRFNSPLPSFAYQKYSFSHLDDSNPYKWIFNHEFPDIFSRLLRNIGDEKDLVVLGFPVQSSDLAFIINWTILGRANCFLGVSEEQNRDYVNSRTPLQKYQENFGLSELIIANTIPPSRLRVVRIFDDDMSYIDQRKKEEKLIKIMQDEFRNVAWTYFINFFISSTVNFLNLLSLTGIFTASIRS